jgi:hypothetical protein
VQHEWLQHDVATGFWNVAGSSIRYATVRALLHDFGLLATSFMLRDKIASKGYAKEGLCSLCLFALNYQLDQTRRRQNKEIIGCRQTMHMFYRHSRSGSHVGVAIDRHSNCFRTVNGDLLSFKSIDMHC